jgi:hypothetical protein
MPIKWQNTYLKDNSNVKLKSWKMTSSGYICMKKFQIKRNKTHRMYIVGLGKKSPPQPEKITFKLPLTQSRKIHKVTIFTYWLLLMYVTCQSNILPRHARIFSTSLNLANVGVQKMFWHKLHHFYIFPPTPYS